MYRNSVVKVTAIYTYYKEMRIVIKYTLLQEQKKWWNKKKLCNISNKWDAVADILCNDYKLHVIKVFQRMKRHYK